MTNDSTPDSTPARTPDTAIRDERITRAATEAAAIALLSVTIADIEDRIMRYTAVPPSVEELRRAVNMVHNAIVTIPGS